MMNPRRFSLKIFRWHPLCVVATVLLTIVVGMSASAITPVPSTGKTPLNDLGSGTYRGEVGGLYPGGTNVRPATHEAAGLVQARGVVPRNAAGVPTSSGRYALVSIGMSNTTQEFQAFTRLVAMDPAKDPHLVLVDGAQGGATAARWVEPGNAAWSVLDRRLAARGLSPLQVAVVWIKLANQAAQAWPSGPLTLEAQLKVIVRALHARFPNLGLAYVSSRIYGGLAISNLSPEPGAYEGGFAAKWMIQDQIEGEPQLNYDPAKGVVEAPWLSWGPYLWADGMIPRSDGLIWERSDFMPDGTHPSLSGRAKVAQMLFDFVHEDATAVEWYLSSNAVAAAA